MSGSKSKKILLNQVIGRTEIKKLVNLKAPIALQSCNPKDQYFSRLDLKGWQFEHLRLVRHNFDGPNLEEVHFVSHERRLPISVANLGYM